MKHIVGTTTEAEFEGLPIAVQRKYFSTLERLRITSGSESYTTRDTAGTRRSIERPRQTSTSSTDSAYTATRTSSRRLQKTNHMRARSISLEDISWFQTLPDKIQRKHFSEEEQQRFRGNTRRKSIVLDAADEAIFKPSRRNRKYALSAINERPLDRAPLVKSKSNMQISNRERPTSTALAMAEQFRWMDEENDLDEKLQLDNYHANLPGVVVPSTTSSTRPSFRRRVSISKIPFSRPNNSESIRMASGPTSFSASGPPMSRGHSRAMSLMSPKIAQDLGFSRILVDPHATHYQDPDARLKLRVYLASPQKFDEAIEFGFPSDEGVLEALSDKENQGPKPPAGSKSAPSDTSKSPSIEDAGSSLEDDVSVAEPDSPVTPSEDLFKHQHSRFISVSEASTTTHNEFSHLCFRKPSLHKHAESYALSSSGAREMTLRMTLTRPDLRAGEDTIYGWQAKERVKTPPSSNFSSALELAPMRGPLNGEDVWGWGPMPHEAGVVKRLWNKVKLQRKAASL